jgi:CCR4-NOT transcription complex subunit 2
MWANPTLRTTPHTTIQRPQGQAQPPQQGQTGQQPGQQPSQQPGQQPGQQLPAQGQDEAAQAQFSGAGDDYRYGGQGGVGQLSGNAQPQTGNIEEFPPLGNTAGEIGPDRRAGLIQNATAFGANTNTSAFPGLGQTRNSLSSPTESQQDRSVNPTVGGRGLSNAGGYPNHPSTDVS